jgi:hypothetical protein
MPAVRITPEQLAALNLDPTMLETIDDDGVVTPPITTIPRPDASPVRVRQPRVKRRDPILQLTPLAPVSPIRKAVRVDSPAPVVKPRRAKPTVNQSLAIAVSMLLVSVLSIVFPAMPGLIIIAIIVLLWWKYKG